MEQILRATNLTSEEYEELSLKKKMGKTTTEENLQLEKKLWQRELLTDELNEDILLSGSTGRTRFVISCP